MRIAQQPHNVLYPQNKSPSFLKKCHFLFFNVLKKSKVDTFILAYDYHQCYTEHILYISKLGSSITHIALQAPGT